MGLAAIQAALARLAIDPTWRDRFYRDPIAVGAEVGLSPTEALALAESDRRPIDEFAASLHRKRRAQIRRTLPIAVRALGDRYGRLFDRYAHEAPPRGSRADLDDALGFVAALNSFPETDRPPWFPDLARYELAWQLAARTGIWPVVRLFRFPVGRLIHLPLAAEVTPAPTLAIWWRPSPRSRLRHVLFPLPRR